YGTYTNSQLCGPAVLQMMLNYIWWNSSNFTTPPMKFDNQTTIYNEALSHNYNPSANYLDTNGMWWYLEHNRPMPYSAYGYHFVKDARATVGEALGDIAFWIDYEIGTYGGLKPGHPSHVPVAVPAYGDYSNWMVVRGIHADQAVYPTYPVTATIYGLWVNDPSSNGLGENTYKTADEFTTTYFLPMNVAGDNPAYNDKYVSITEPPEQGTINVNIANSPQLLTPEQMRTKTGIVKVDPVKETALDAIQTLASETDDQSIPTQLIAEKVITVNGNGRRYYIVTFTMETPRISTTHITTIVLPVVAAVAIDYSTGALMEISIPKTPVKFFDGLSYTSGKYIQIGPSTFDIAYRVNIGGFFYDISPDGTMTPAV
ncbi:MAG: hypothetical protein NT038_07305, partial [Euryarchaeota archaeon]|nr:hypothetical protein [Euryarchaeota archaeon]